MSFYILDVYHGDNITSMSEMKRAGVVGLIHKATQGDSSFDPAYAMRRRQWMNGEPAIVDGQEVPVVWGAYTFNTGADVKAQLDNFMSHAEPDDDTLMALDFEDNRASNMTFAQAREFLLKGAAALGRAMVLYSGNRLKELMPHAALADRQFVATHRLWLAQYSSRAVLPPMFSQWWLWQRWADGFGPKPIPVIPGIAPRIDTNIFGGTIDQLQEEWAGWPPSYKDLVEQSGDRPA